jgi:Zn-dependent peptidase ImmA (M78 family)
MSLYDEVKILARTKRSLFSVRTDTLNLNVVRKIYKEEGIKIDHWKFGRTVRAVYMCENADPSVAVNESLPREPKLFSLVHELKHHYLDRNLIENGAIKCGDYNANELIEKTAEVFAAEFIYPETEFLDLVDSVQIQKGKCTKEQVVDLKRASSACISYQFLQKRLIRLGFAPVAGFGKVQFTKLEEEMYGTPIYKQEWFRARRTARKA